MASKKYARPGWTEPSVVNKIRMGETLLTSQGFQLRRVLGGFMYEYLDKSENVTCAVFVSNNEQSTQ